MHVTTTLTTKQGRDVRIAASSMACISTLAGLIALYWFVRMKKKQFRHELIMMLVLADLYRGINYIAFTATTTAGRTIVSSDSYCMASGFMLQMGTEMGDLTILFMVIHMAMQIFDNRIAVAAESGLAKYRYWVFSIIVALPALSAGIAFIGSGYVMQGPWCSLAIRPFWYRVALAWTPRYIITIIIIVATLAMQMRVKRYGKEIRELTDSQIPTSNDLRDEGIISEIPDIEKYAYADPRERVDMPAKPAAARRSWRLSLPKRTSTFLANTWLLPMDEQSDGDESFTCRSASVVATSITPDSNVIPATPVLNPGLLMPDSAMHQDTSYFANPNSRRASLNEVMLQAKFPVPSRSSTTELVVPKRHERLGSVSSARHERLGSISSNRLSSIADSNDPWVPSITTTPSGKSDKMASVCVSTRCIDPPRAPSVCRRASLAEFAMRTFSFGSRVTVVEEDDSPAVSLAKRHRYVQRQMRLLLLYPILYILVWLCPFALHCLQYSSSFEKMHLFPLVLLSFTSQTSFGLLNVLVFCMREKPWTMIPNSDGTLLGSFVYDRRTARARTLHKLSR